MAALRHVPITASLSFGWKKTWDQLGFVISFLLVVLGLQIGLGILQGLGVGLTAKSGLTGLVIFVFSVVRMVMNIVIGMAGINATLQIAAGKRPTIASSFDRMGNINLIIKYGFVSLVVGIISFLGFLLFIIPGIYLSIKYKFAGYSLVDKNTNFNEAMKVSGQITRGVKLELFAFGIIACFINMLGALFLGIGLLVTIPMTAIALAYIYRHLIGIEE